MFSGQNKIRPNLIWFMLYMINILIRSENPVHH